MAALILDAAPGARLAVAGVLDGPRGQEGGTAGQILAGLQWLLDLRAAGQPISVINASFAIYDARAANLSELLAALELAAVQGVVPVLAVGNLCDRASLLASRGTSVGSLTASGRSVARFSGPSPHLVAPGENVVVRLPESAVACSGTSKSAAYTSAALALLVEASGQPVGMCLAALHRAAERLRASVPDAHPSRWGSGPVNVIAARAELP